MPLSEWLLFLFQPTQAIRQHHLNRSSTAIIGTMYHFIANVFIFGYTKTIWLCKWVRLCDKVSVKRNIGKGGSSLLESNFTHTHIAHTEQCVMWQKFVYDAWKLTLNHEALRCHRKTDPHYCAFFFFCSRSLIFFFFVFVRV